MRIQRSSYGPSNVISLIYAYFPALKIARGRMKVSGPQESIEEFEDKLKQSLHTLKNKRLDERALEE